MTVAIMQPYLFPYIGYWQLITSTDEFIFFDIVQYNKKSWMNRNRILHPNKPDRFQYISVPIKKHIHGTLIKDTFINNDEKWREKILGQLTVYKKLRAPFYNETITLLKQIFNNDIDNFLNLAIGSTKQICEYLNIDFKYKVTSDINFDRNLIEGSGDWALAICKKLNADKYINPHGGYKIFNEKKYNDNGIDIRFIKSKLTPYKQSIRTEFHAGLSIIDVLMFNEKEKVNKLLINDFSLLSKDEVGELIG
jgi:WbqC-like protein family